MTNQKIVVHAFVSLHSNLSKQNSPTAQILGRALKESVFGRRCNVDRLTIQSIQIRTQPNKNVHNNFPICHFLISLFPAP